MSTDKTIAPFAIFMAEIASKNSDDTANLMKLSELVRGIICSDQHDLSAHTSEFKQILTIIGNWAEELDARRNEYGEILARMQTQLQDEIAERKQSKEGDTNATDSED